MIPRPSTIIVGDPTQLALLGTRPALLGTRLARSSHFARLSRLAPQAIMLTCFFALAGCRSGSEVSDGSEQGGAPISQSAKDGPVELKITAQRGTLPFSQHCALTVEAIAEPDVTVELVDYESIVAEAHQEFEYRVVRIDRRSAVPTQDGRLKWTFRYDLSFYLAGEYELPAARLSYVEGGSPVDDGESPPEAHELETPTLTVVAVDPEDTQLTPEELRNLTVLPPVELPEPLSPTVWIAAGVATIVALALWMILRRTKRIREIAAVTISAHDWAHQQIGRLIHEDLIAAGEFQEFHYRLTDILCGYIERRYAVSAREMTTEEFLAAASSDARFGSDATTELDRFLAACDMVKYARHETHSTEAQSLLQTVVDFVERTRQRTAPVQADGRPNDSSREQAA